MHILVKWLILLYILLLLFHTLQIKSVLQKEMMNYIFVGHFRLGQEYNNS